MDPDYERTHPDYSGYTKRFENKPVVTEAVASVNKRKKRNNGFEKKDIASFKKGCNRFQ